MPFFLSVVPIVVLIWMMTKKNAVPSYIALPLSALFVYVIQLVYFNTDFILLKAGIITGIIATLTPVTVIMGAILFNRFQQLSGCQETINKWLISISPNPIAQFLVIGWAFAYMIEGASGFGTPAAITAPILIGMGYQPLKVVITVLIFNSVPVSFGAVGTPTWFGFGSLGLEQATILEIGYKAALIHCVEAFIIPLIALRFSFSWKKIKANLGFIYLSVLSCAVPGFILSAFSDEFPSLIGGAIGFLVSIIAAKKGWGLAKEDSKNSTVVKEKLPVKTILMALLPTIILIFTLVITRVQQLGLKEILRTSEILTQIELGIFGRLDITEAFKFTFVNILGTTEFQDYELLFAPAMIPFFSTVFLLMVFYPPMKGKVKILMQDTCQQIKQPLFALLGGVIMVKFMLLGGDDSMVKIIGSTLADATGNSWELFAAYLGSVGSFFSGSNAISNLIFGGVQQSIAEATGLSITTVLALQSIGGAMGNMTCINNIIAACSVSGIQNQEGYIIKRTALPMTLYGVIAAMVAFVVF